MMYFLIWREYCRPKNLSKDWSVNTTCEFWGHPETVLAHGEKWGLSACSLLNWAHSPPPQCGEWGWPWVCRESFSMTSAPLSQGWEAGARKAARLRILAQVPLLTQQNPRCQLALLCCSCFCVSRKYLLVLLFLCKTAYPSLCLPSQILCSQSLWVIVIVPVAHFVHSL